MTETERRNMTLIGKPRPTNYQEATVVAHATIQEELRNEQETETLAVMTVSEWLDAPDDTPIAAIVTDAEASVARIQEAQSTFWATVARLHREHGTDDTEV